MKTTSENKMWAYMNALRETMVPDSILESLLLISEVKSRSTGELTKEIAYQEMLGAADTLHILNPFKDEDQFFEAYRVLENDIVEMDWEMALYQDQTYARRGQFVIPECLLNEMDAQIKPDAKTILIADGERFVPNLTKFVEKHSDCSITVTTQNAIYSEALKKALSQYGDVKVQIDSIYTEKFLPEQFDFILSMPAFGLRGLASGSEHFMCKEFEMIALENLLLHMSPSGTLAIIMPGKVTFAGGSIAALRNFITQMYKLEMIAELPDGIFQGTGIKTYLLVISSGRTEDVDICRYRAVDQGNRRDQIKQIEKSDDTFVLQDEIVGAPDWNVDRFFRQQNEEFLKFESSATRKIALGQIAEIFRGKSVTKKDDSGDIGVVNISNIRDYDIDYDNLDKINDEDRRVQKYILQEGDVLLPARGTAIRTAIFHKQSYTCIASSNVIVIRPNQKELNSVYLKIFLDSPIGRSIIAGLQQGMTIINVSYNDLKLMEVPSPSMEEQEKVAKEYSEGYAEYKKSISEAEQRWQRILDKVQKF